MANKPPSLFSIYPIATLFMLVHVVLGIYFFYHYSWNGSPESIRHIDNWLIFTPFISLILGVIKNNIHRSQRVGYSTWTLKSLLVASGIILCIFSFVSDWGIKNGINIFGWYFLSYGLLQYFSLLADRAKAY